VPKRFFAFGCSCTYYKWLTWADIASYHLNRRGYQCYNFGMAGAGNQLIFYNLILANTIYKFTDNDIIMVVWSSWPREDRLVNNKYSQQTAYMLDEELQWSSFGSVLNNTDHWHNQYAHEAWTLENDFVKNLSCILACKSMFNIDFEGHIDPIENLKKIESIIKPYNVDNHPLLLKLLNQEINLGARLEYSQEDYKDQEDINVVKKDGHPQPLNYLHYVKHVIQPNVKIELVDDTTIKFVREYWQKHRIMDFKEMSESTDNIRKNFVSTDLWGGDFGDIFHGPIQKLINQVHSLNKS